MPTGMPLLNPCSPEILWKSNIKKKTQLYMVISQKLGQIQSKNSDFLKVHSIFFKLAPNFTCRIKRI